MSTARDPVAVIQAFDAAWNAGDLETAMACFADDAVVTQLPAPPDGGVYRGKEQIRRWAEPQIPVWCLLTASACSTMSLVAIHPLYREDLANQSV